MPSVVQLIADRVNYTSQSPRKPHVENNSPKAESRFSVRGKKGIARNRASLIVTKKEAVNYAVKGAATPAKTSFLDNQSVNGNATFNFKAKPFRQSSSSSPNSQPSGTYQEEEQPIAQVIMEAQASSDIVERVEGEPFHSKANLRGAELIARD